MGITCNEMKSKKQQIEKELEEIYRMEAQFPQGELRCSKNNSRYKWLFKDKKGTAYLPKKKRELAEAYRNHACDKVKLYCANGIIPSINLITTYETKRHPLFCDMITIA